METKDPTRGSVAEAANPAPCGELGEDVEWGERLYRELVAHFDVETEPWAVELVQRAAERLNRKRAPAAPLEPIILWMTTPTAFIGPGRYIYFSRGLLHQACWEEAVAFGLAHEMAHHDLGHTQLYRRKLALVRYLPGSMIVAAVLGIADHWLNGPEYETAADARALNLCLAAGYDGTRCVQLFDVFEAYALDYHAIECVFGPEDDLTPPREGLRDWRAAAQSWIWHRRYGYLPIRVRKEALLARLNAPSRARAA
jgi:predicted Zn-dependent protease